MFRYKSISTLVVGFILLFTISTLAQFDGNNPSLSVDFRQRSGARVDPVSHALQFNLTLGDYPGRGSNFPIVLSYSSKVWAFGGPNRTDRTPTTPGEGPYNYTYSQDYGGDAAAGWSSSLDWIKFPSTTGNDRYDMDGKVTTLNPYSGQEQRMVARMYIRLPDGSKHEFRRDDTVYDVTSVYCYSGCDTPRYVYSPVNLTGTFLSVDGTGMKFVTATNTLWMPNGSRYVFAGTASSPQSVTHYDVNGNAATYSYSNDTWTDTMGRVFETPLPDQNQVGTGINAGPRTDVYELPGLGNDTQNYTLRWKYLRDPVTNETVLSDPNQELKPFGDRESTQNCNLVSSLFHSIGECFLGNDGDDSKIVRNTTFNPVVLAEIEIPNGTKYIFRYNVYGEIDRIIYPTGAYERFEHGAVTAITPYNFDDGDASPPIYSQTNRGVKKHWVSPTGSETDEILTEYTGSFDTTNPDGTRIERVVQQGRSEAAFGFDDARAGSVLEERFYASTNQIMRRTLNSYAMQGSATSGPTRDSRLEKTISIIAEPNESDALMSMTVNEFDTSTNAEYFAHLNVKRVKEYGYIVLSKTEAQNLANNFATFEAYFSSQTPARVTETDYLYDTNYKARNLTRLPAEMRVEDANNNPKAKTQIIYDGASLLDESESTRWENPNTIYRGLVTKTRSWYDIANNLYIDTQAQYDLMGNLRYATDGRGNQTQTVYSSTYDYAYPTSVITPAPDSTGTNGSNTAFTTTSTYDYNTGLPLTVTDANGGVTEFQYNDPLLRPTKTIAPNGQQTITEYGAGTSASTLWVKSKSQIDETNWKEGYVWLDGIGRTIRTQSVDDDGDVFVLTCYDNMGRVLKTSNPFRGYTSQTCTTTTGMEWTAPTYDALGRTTSVTTPDGAHVHTAYSLATSGSQKGTVVTVEDQADKQRRSITNALGQLIRVDEPDNSSSTGSLGSISSPNQPTLYTYDLSNNLTGVQQDGDTTAECGGASTCTQMRTFQYDALSRLKSATNPESGTINYTYDANSNLATKVDARSITTTYTYDRLNRVTLRAYTNEPSGSETPDVSYFYDNLTNAKGRLTKVQSSVSTTEYTSFDILGRVTASKQTTDGVTYGNGTTDSPMTYTYDLAGALIEQQYPSGRKVQNELDVSGDLAVVKSKKNATSGPFHNYAFNFAYNAAGAVTSMELGNLLYESTVFNSRLQPTQIALGTSANATDLLKLNYAYNTTGNADNNGNVLTQTITVPTVGTNNGFAAIQSYNYDSLNRLKDATESLTPAGGSATETWKQSFGYDRYGNRNFKTGTGETTTLGSCATAVCNPAISPSNNKITSTGYSFDAVGNTTFDAALRKFTYDAENKQTKVESTNSGQVVTGTVGEYSYDGDGKRVKKIAGDEVTIFVYDAAGKLVAEYSTIVAASNDAKVTYLTNDHLGSPRINTDANGAVTTRHDYHPFGEEIATSQRVSGLGFTDYTVRKQFTGYERDDETDLDFAEARYFTSDFGRFTSPDRPLLDQSLSDPQSWNLYVYAGNSPLKYTDPHGLWKSVECEGGAKTCWEAEEGDTYESLAAILNVAPDNLAAYFGNQDIIAGRSTFDTSGYFDWVNQDKSGGRLANDLGYQWGYNPPLFGGVKIVGQRSGFFGWIGKYAGKVGRALGILGPKKAASVAELAAKRLVGSNQTELLRDAVNIVKGFTGTAQQKAELFEEFARQITQRTGGAWQATKSVGSDGATIFIGQQIGRALVISPEGEIFMGNITKDVGSFLYGKGNVITPVYEKLTKIQ